ncbi:MAG: nucleoside-triphosphatase [Bacteroidales bacterium]|jgi:nucleoside-triphosphatase THEP1
MSDKWLRAATIGSIWASIEIIIGSFLHNLRLPLAGSILSFFAVVLMVSFLKMWPQKGIIWRAGLICALMKSISPSAVILGPMTGIMLEAMLMELGLFVLGMNMAGMILGGMLAVLSALFHKAVNLLILYGNDFATLLNRLVQYAAKQLRMESMTGVDVLLLLILVYLIAGAFASIAGWRLSGNPGENRNKTEDWTVAHEPVNRLFGFSERQSYSIWLLAGHLVVLVLLLLGMNRLPVQFWILPVLIYLAFSLIRYNRALRQLLKPRFWIQLILITLLSTVLLQSVATGQWFDRSGFEAGVLMNLRAFMVLTAFTAISTELKNPLIKALVFRQGFASLYKSVSLAFSVLPGLVSFKAVGDNHRLAFRSTILEYLNRADEIYEQFKNLEASLPEITLITGDREEGKTTFLQNMVDDLINEGKRVTGFTAIGIHDSSGVRCGFNIRNIETRDEAEFCRTTGQAHWDKIGKYYINPQGLATGYQWMATDRIRHSDILVIDELGPLEMAGKGWSQLISRILEEDPKPMIWTVRRKLAAKMAVRWNVGKVVFVDINA